jgi:hypothetical protein
MESPLGKPTFVGDIHIRDPKGRLILSGENHELDFGDELFVGGKSLVVVDQPDGVISIEGQSPYVTLNGIILSNSPWTASPVEIRAAIVGGLFVIIGVYIAYFLSKRKRKAL